MYFVALAFAIVALLPIVRLLLPKVNKPPKESVPLTVRPAELLNVVAALRVRLLPTVTALARVSVVVLELVKVKLLFEVVNKELPVPSAVV